MELISDIELSKLCCTCSTSEHIYHYNSLRIFTLDKWFKQTYVANPDYPPCAYVKYSCPHCRNGYKIAVTKLIQKYLIPNTEGIDIKNVYRNGYLLEQLYMRWILEKVKTSKSTTFAMWAPTSEPNKWATPEYMCKVTNITEGTTSLICPKNLSEYIANNLRPNIKLQLELVEDEQ